MANQTYPFHLRTLAHGNSALKVYIVMIQPRTTTAEAKEVKSQQEEINNMREHMEPSAQELLCVDTVNIY
jgi:hypothetical protein